MKQKASRNVFRRFRVLRCPQYPALVKQGQFSIPNLPLKATFECEGAETKGCGLASFQSRRPVASTQHDGTEKQKNMGLLWSTENGPIFGYF